jgi:hypothetical protein
MKQCIVLSTLVLLGGTISNVTAQEKAIDKSKVPAPVLKAFQGSYPHATVKAYKKETEKGKTYFEIESVDGKTNRDLLYASDGTVVEIEEAVEMNQLPEAVAKALKKDFPSGKITKSEKTTHGANISYEFVVTSGKNKYEVAYSTDGKQLSKEQVKMKKEKEEKENEEEDD